MIKMCIGKTVIANESYFIMAWLILPLCLWLSCQINVLLISAATYNSVNLKLHKKYNDFMLSFLWWEGQLGHSLLQALWTRPSKPYNMVCVNRVDGSEL